MRFKYRQELIEEKRRLNKKIFFFFLFLLGCSMVILNGLTRTDKIGIPKEVLFANPKQTMLRISPDGTKLSYLAPGKTEDTANFLNLWVKDIDKDNDKQLTFANNRSLSAYTWPDNSDQILYIRDTNGDENWHLYGLILATGETKDYTPFKGVRVSILAKDKKFPNTILITMNKEDSKVFDVYSLDLNTGEITLKEKNTGLTAGWYHDKDLNIKAKIDTSAKGQTVSIKKGNSKNTNAASSTGSNWQDIITWAYEDSQNSSFLGFDKSEESVYLLDSRDSDTTKLVKLNLEKNTIEVIAQEQSADIDTVLIDDDTKEPYAYSYTSDYKYWVPLNESFKQLLEDLNKLGSGNMHIVDHDHNLKNWVVAFDQDIKPTEYYVYNSENKTAKKIFSTKPELEAYKNQLCTTQPVSFTAKDGLKINGYLTYPKDAGNNDTKCPLILKVHGGPWARDVWGFDSSNQWLASRGYAVLQINYRGSSGYGKAFTNAAIREWGAKMHQDLLDGIDFVASQGKIDPKRVAIYGGSYGGYAALVGAAFTPDVFSCAIDMVGPSNLISLINTIPDYWEIHKEWFYKHVGHPVNDEALLKERSPLYKAHNIKIPLLIAQGANDPRVKQNEAEQIVAALKEHNLPHEYLLFPDEGHGLSNQNNKFKFYQACEEFLDKHL